VGRGPGSGHGKTAGRGHKGFKARSGGGIKVGFEGGQMPLHRRIPKRGFNNVFRKECAVLNVADLDRFEAGTRIDRQMLVEAGLVAKKYSLVKLLGDGEITKAVIVAVDKLSESARKKIEAAGGKIEG
jgi:large subunit ribosomal protein L15